MFKPIDLSKTTLTAMGWEAELQPFYLVGGCVAEPLLCQPPEFASILPYEIWREMGC
jgi:hypothetical protein